MKKEDEAKIVAYLDGTIDGEDLAILEQTLEADPEARRRFRMHAAIAESLNSAPPRSPEPESGNKKHLAFAWSVAGLSFLLALALFLRPLVSNGNSPSDQQPSNFAALLVAEAGSTFATNAAPKDFQFLPGAYDLTEGAVHLRFSNGTDLVMRAPAEFEIEDSFHVILKRGDVRAIVPLSGQGFTISTSRMIYEDLGTEFGLSAREDGSSELHVFNGQVDAYKSKSDDAPVVSAYTGRSLAFDTTGGYSELTAPPEDRYLTPSSIAVERWKKHSEVMTSDKHVIGWFNFDNIQDGQLINNAATPRIPNGTIRGTYPVTGRWPGKGGLLFDREKDAIEINFPEQYEELTFVLSLKPVSFDYSMNALLNSDGWQNQTEAMHWQITRLGELQVQTIDNRGSGWMSPPRALVAPGKWQMLATSLSTKTGKRKLYLNGQLVSEGKLSPDISLAPGNCRLGNWNPLSDVRATTRSLKARIDEFSVWNRALSDKEIEALANSGKPVALLPENEE